MRNPAAAGGSLCLAPAAIPRGRSRPWKRCPARRRNTSRPSPCARTTSPAYGGGMAPSATRRYVTSKEGLGVALGADWRLGGRWRERVRARPFGREARRSAAAKVRDALQLDAGRRSRLVRLRPRGGRCSTPCAGPLPARPQPPPPALRPQHLPTRRALRRPQRHARGDDVLGTLVVDISRLRRGDLVLTTAARSSLPVVDRASRPVAGPHVLVGRVLRRRRPRGCEVTGPASGSPSPGSSAVAGAVTPRSGASTHADRLADALTVALVDPSFFPTGTTLGFSCFHMYARRRGSSGRRRRSTRARRAEAQGARPADRRGGAAPQAPVRFVPYLLEDQVDSRWALARYRPTPSARCFEATGSARSTSSVACRWSRADRDAVRWVVTPARGDRGRAAARSVAGRPAIEFLGEPIYSRDGLLRQRGGPQGVLARRSSSTCRRSGVRKRAPSGATRKPAETARAQGTRADGPPATARCWKRLRRGISPLPRCARSEQRRPDETDGGRRRWDGRASAGTASRGPVMERPPSARRTPQQFRASPSVITCRRDDRLETGVQRLRPGAARGRGDRVARRADPRARSAGRQLLDLPVGAPHSPDRDGRQRQEHRTISHRGRRLPPAKAFRARARPRPASPGSWATRRAPQHRPWEVCFLVGVALARPRRSALGVSSRRTRSTSSRRVASGGPRQ